MTSLYSLVATFLLAFVIAPSTGGATPVIDADVAVLHRYHPVDAFVVGDSLHDSDSDGLPDDDERTIYNTNPNSNDTDGDGLLDGDEINKHHTNPVQRDSDFDTVSDFDEVTTHRTDPVRADTDGDGRSDGQEVLVDATNPTVADSTGVPAVRRRFDGPPCSVDSIEIFFAAGVSQFDMINYPENIRKLDAILECTKSCPQMILLIEGNASSDGRVSDNQRLSDRRAEQVYYYLVRAGGLDPKRIIRRNGVGSRIPKVSERGKQKSTDLRAARSGNRRVVVMVMKKCVG